MTLQITAAGRTRAVEVSRRDAHLGHASGGQEKFVVTLDGREHEVSVSDIDGVRSLLIGNRSYEITAAPTADGTTMVHVDGVPVEVSIAAPLSWRSRATGAGSAAGQAEGPQRVVAPMPGKIVKVLVRPGDRVEPRQGLVVVEAMKMENELRSRAAGTVTDVRAIEGSSVEAGAILIVVE